MAVAVFVYVCIWLTHQSSRVMSMTCSQGMARQGCARVMPFRLLRELNVTQGEVSGKERTAEASGGRLRGCDPSAKERSQLQKGPRALAGHPAAQHCLRNGVATGFNKGLTARCKWRVIHKEPLMARTRSVSV